jgi:ABC-type oligopeptide transport system ATPase subunit
MLVERMNLLEVKNLKKYFVSGKNLFGGKQTVFKAIDDLSFEIKKGEILGVVGESGSGKSTLAKCLIALLKPTDGTIYFEAKPLKFTKKGLINLRKEVQMVFQDPYASLNPRKTIFTSLSEPLYYHGIIRDYTHLRKNALAILDSVGIKKDALDRYPHEFSGGQQQRICIGRAIALKPKLLLLDEAVSALDVSVQSQILNLLFNLQEEYGLSYLFISHDLNIVGHFSDRVLVMHMGKIVEEGITDNLFKNPKEPYTKMLLSSVL